MAGLFNGTCPIPLNEIKRPNIEEPIVGSLKFQQLIVYISLGSAAYTTIVCCYLALTHLLHYVRAREQRQIIRLSFYPLFFAVFSAAAVYSYPDSIYLEPARDLIEPISLAALFLLFLEYAEPDPSRREEYFRTLELQVPVRKFSKEIRVIPGGSFRWFQGKWVALFCYLIADILMKAIEIITQAAGRYCQSSFSLAFAHIWCTVISYIALPVGIIAVIQFYIRIKNEPHVHVQRPSQKIWAFKGVLLLNFVQEIIFTILVSAKIFKGTKQVTLADFQIGIPACLLALEQVVASSMFLWAFPVRPYKELKYGKKMNPLYALINACNIMDLVYGSIYAIQLLAKGVGPYGNGSWNKVKGGYDKLKDPITDVQIKRAQTYRGRKSFSDDQSVDEESVKDKHQQVEMNIGLVPKAVHHDVQTDPEREWAYGNSTGLYDGAAYHGSGDLGEDKDRLLAHTPRYDS